MQKKISDFDKDHLSQLIRMMAHLIEMATKRDREEKDTADQHYADTQALLNEWKRRGYENNDYVQWALNVVDSYRDWTIKKITRGGEKQNIQKADDSIGTVIKERRSVRFWKKQKVSQEDIIKIIEGATYSPSSFNRMPWKFLVFENSIENIIEGDSTNESMLLKAPIRIYVAIDERLYEEKSAAAIDAGIVIQNMALMTQSLGLSSCMIYQCEIADQKKICDYFEVPYYFHIYSVLLVGYPDEAPQISGRIDPDEVMIYKKAECLCSFFSKKE